MKFSTVTDKKFFVESCFEASMEVVDAASDERELGQVHAVLGSNSLITDLPFARCLALRVGAGSCNDAKRSSCVASNFVEAS